MPAYGIQLYTLRDRPEPLPGLIREAAACGFEGVEFADRLFSTDVRQVRAALDGTGIQSVGLHADVSTIQERGDIVQRCAAVGCPRVVIPHLSIEQFRTRQAVDHLADTLRAMGNELARDDLTLCVHTTREMLLPIYSRSAIDPIMNRAGLPKGVYNHVSWLGGVGIPRSRQTLEQYTPLGHLLAATNEIEFEIDAKSVATAGFPIETVLGSCGDRSPLVHLSDVRRMRRFPPDYAPVSPGDGIVRPDEVIDAAQAHECEWVIVEHDEPSDPDVILDELSDLLELSSPLPVEMGTN